jgi:hypothetical protein
VKAKGRKKPVKQQKRGRPEVLTAQKETRLLNLVTEGSMLIDACRKVGISYRTVAKKEREDDPFCHRLARARVAGAAICLERAEKKLDRATNKNIQIVREQALHQRWKAAKLIPAYRDRVEMAVKPASPEPERSFEQLTRLEKLDLARRQCFLLARFGKSMRDDWGLPNLAEGFALLAAETMKQTQGVLEGRPLEQPAALLPAPAEPPSAGHEREIEINPPPQRDPPQHRGSRHEQGLG